MGKTNSYIDYLFRSSTCHQLLMLNLIYQEPSGADIELLTEQIGIDRRSIYRYIDYLKDVCSRLKLDADIIRDAKSYYIFTGDLIDYYKLRSELIAEEPIFNLAVKFVSSKMVDFTRFCQANFIGESTFKRQISKANRLLIQLGIKIINRKGQLLLEGEERIIRYCLISFLWRVYRGTTWPFKIEEDKVYGLIDTIISPRKQASYGIKKQLSFYLAVFLSRSAAKSNIQRELLPEYTLNLVPVVRNYDSISEKLLSSFELPQEEIDFVLLNLFIFPECYEFFFNTSDTLEILKSYSSKSYKSILNFQRFMKEKHPDWDMNHPKNPNFMPMLISGRIFVDLFQNLYFNSSAISIFKHAAKAYPNLLPQIQKRLLKFEPRLSQNKLKSLSLRYAQAYVMEFSPQDFEPEIRILLASDMAMYLDKLVIDRVEHLLKDRFNFKLTTDSTTPKIDLVLSTGVVEEKLEDIRRIYINPEITKKDSETIIADCYTILDEKIKNLQ